MYLNLASTKSAAQGAVGWHSHWIRVTMLSYVICNTGFAPWQHAQASGGKTWRAHFFSVTPTRHKKCPWTRSRNADRPPGPSTCGWDGKGQAQHSLTDLKQACTSSHTHTHTHSYRWVVILSHAVENAAVISAFSKAGFKAVLPADSSWYWSKTHLTPQSTSIKVIKCKFAYLSWLDQLPCTLRGMSFIHLNKARNPPWIWMEDIMCECVQECEECVFVCTYIHMHAISSLASWQERSLISQH